MDEKDLKSEKDKEKRIQELIGDSIGKVKNQTENNEKMLTEKSNTLNWLLTLTTVLFAFLNSNNDLDIQNCYLIVFTSMNKIIFLLLVVSFIVFKIYHQKFLKNQILLYSSLDTHHLELKYNVHKIKDSLLLKDLDHPPFIFSVIDFFKGFTSLEFRFYKGHDDRDKIFKGLYNKAESLSKIVENIYIITVVIFSVYTLIWTLMMFM